MPWDADLLSLANQTLACPVLDHMMLAITMITTPVPVCLFLLGLYQFKKREGLGMFAAFVGSVLVAVGLQFLLGRSRPAGVRLIEPMPAFPSFPSGHAAGAFALATLTALLWPRRRWIPFLGAGLVAFSRVYLGHHYPTDVLAGAVLGAAVGAMVYGFFYAPAAAGRPRWAWLLWGQTALVLLATLAASLQLLSFGFLVLPGADKALHFLLFGLLAFFGAAWWSRRPAWSIVAVLGLLALLEEVSQALLPGRSADVLDLGAALAGMILFAWLSRRLTTRRRPNKMVSRPKLR
jgi:undecaprenyl-diphosphatase